MHCITFNIPVSTGHGYFEVNYSVCYVICISNIVSLMYINLFNFLNWIIICSSLTEIESLAYLDITLQSSLSSMASVEPGGLSVRRREVTAGLLRRMGEDLRGERWTDLVLHSREGVPVQVHRLVLAQCPHLAPLLSSLQCCQVTDNYYIEE